MTRRTPIILVSLFLGGAMIFLSHAFLPVPIEEYFAIAGLLVFASGMIFGLIASFRSLFVLTRADSRRTLGILTPILTLVITAGTWFVVVTTAIVVYRSLMKRDQYEDEHWEEIHGKESVISQPSAGSDSTNRAAAVRGSLQQ